MVGLAACEGAPLAPEFSKEQAADLTLRERTLSLACHDAGACVPTNEACEGPSGVTACCDPEARCMEYTVYDYRRCRKPYPNGEYCYRDDQCATNRCDNGSCACAPRSTAPTSCDTSRGKLTVTPSALVWDDPAVAWQAGSLAYVDLEFDNDSADQVNYPGAQGSASDPRVAIESPWADFYALFACSKMQTRHIVRLAETIPSGTRIELAFRGTVVDQDDQYRCRPELPMTVSSIVVP
jgi:hypothetical protein